MAPVEVVELLRSAKPNEWEIAVQTAAQTIEARGEARAGVRMLTLVLETRFGPLPDEVRNRIGAADMSQLDRWATKAPNAPTLDAVINGHDAD